VKLEDDLVRPRTDLFVVNTNNVAGIGNFDTGNPSFERPKTPSFRRVTSEKAYQEYSMCEDVMLTSTPL
jgi:hypothetical protein